MWLKTLKPNTALRAIEKVCIAVARTLICHCGLTWCIRSGPVTLLPLLGVLTPQSGSGACVSCFATVDFAFVQNRPTLRTGDNQVVHLSEE